VSHQIFTNFGGGSKAVFSASSFNCFIFLRSAPWQSCFVKLIQLGQKLPSQYRQSMGTPHFFLQRPHGILTVNAHKDFKCFSYSRMSLTYAFSKPVVPTEYTRLKNTLKKSTVGYGTVLSASYFITQGADQGVSAMVGATASYAYVTLLSNRVDTFEKSAFQTEFLAPLGVAAFEVSWNNAPFAFDFDYGATFVGFLAYKFALSTVLYETVREMMLGDSEAFYDTEEKVYNDLSEDEN